MLGKEDTNGINAMLAHQNRSGDDNNFVRNVIGSYMFLGFGVVTKIAGERMEVFCGDHSYTNVELMVLGVDGWGLKMVPAVNDRVLLLSTQVPVYDLKLFVATGSMPPYDQSGIKAIPLTDTSTAQLITVNKSGINVTGSVKLTVNNAGIRVEDNNKNIVETTNSGISVTDANKNTAVMSASGVTITDAINVAGANKNTVEMTSSGVKIKDNQGNSIAMTSSGVTINDKNGNSVAMGTDSVKINNKLEIGQ